MGRDAELCTERSAPSRPWTRHPGRKRRPLLKSTDRYTGPWNATTTTPILLIGTRYDPNTAYRNAVRSQLLLGNAVLLTHWGYGHLSVQDPSACSEAARTRYLVDLELPAPGTVCMADQQPFNF